MRRIPSNRMPRRPTVQTSPAEASIALLLLAALLSLPLALLWPVLGLVGTVHLALGVTKLGWLMSLLNRRYERRMQTARAGESICTFARGFDCRTTDTWIIRAVYEAVQPTVRFPLRPSDRFSEELRIDLDDELLEWADEISWRTGRSLEEAELNPCANRIETVADLVAFFSHQPRVAKAA